MILNIGREIVYGKKRYQIMELLHADKGGYREEYLANVYEGKRKKTSGNARITVYKQRLEDAAIRAHIVGLEEVLLRQKLSSQTFDPRQDDFDMLDEDNKPMFILVADMVETITLREAISNYTLEDGDIWQVFADVVVGLNEISHHTNGGCHFGLSPDNIYIYQDENHKHRGLIRGLNLICNDYDNNKGLDKSLVLPEFRAPETHMLPFTPKAMQWSLALLLTYMLQGQHPWDLSAEVSQYIAYSRLRHNKPKILIEGELGNVLRKALSVDPTRRYDEIDDFISEIMKYSEIELPNTYKCFGKPTKHTEPPSSSSTKETVVEDVKMEDDAKSDPIMEIGKEPKSSVKISKVNGEGFRAVAGMNELKAELRRDFMDVIANRSLASQYGIIPPSMLFYGPPGCGKTYLAEHLAQELGIEFSLVNPSDLGSIYIHGSQKMIADLFANAEKQAKLTGKGVLLIFDELESMVPSRKSEHNENQAGEVAEFLTRLNNSSQRGVYVIGLTNCLDKIDKAVLRKGTYSGA